MFHPSGPMAPKQTADEAVRCNPFMTSAMRGGGGVRELADFADEPY